jgi:hypothetical protein
MRATIMLSDWAESVNGKLYMQGGAWDRIVANTPASFAVSVVVRVEYNETNVRRHAVLALVDEDGSPFPAEAPVRFELDFEVGRPPGMQVGQVQTVNFAGKIGGLIFPPGGYRFQFDVESHRQDDVPFQAVPSLK